MLQSVIQTYGKILDMTTKDALNTCLKIIGSDGFAGLQVRAKDAQTALNLILKKSPAKTVGVDKLLKELKRQTLVDVRANNTGYSFTITPAGIYRLQKVRNQEIIIPTPKKWDRKWRIITFDVPVRQTAARAAFTAHLQRLGFVMVQKSLWAYPYPCFPQVEEMASYYNVSRYCTMMEVSRLDDLSTRRLLARFSQLSPV